jgi:putative membrane protein
MLSTAVVVLAAGNASAQTTRGGVPAAVDDKLFAAAAAESGASEIAMSRLGVQKAVDPELKRFSQAMIDEHTKMNAELTSTAAAKAIALPREVGPCPQFKLQSLAGLSGEEFDKCYAEAQFLAHKEAVAIFKAESERGQDPDVKALAAKALPKIQGHLEMIKPIAMKHEKGGATTSASR